VQADLRSGGAVHALTKRARFLDEVISGLVDAERREVCLVAVGGYARGWLFPGSDVDLMFVHPPGAEQDAESLASRVLYALWDAGLQVSHAVRTPKECVREAERDPKSLTTVLGARRLAGPTDLFEQARDGVRRVAARKPLWFVDVLRRSRDERRERSGILHHQQEPDLKEALGGVRDLHIAWWLADGLAGATEEGAVVETLDLAVPENFTALMGARAVLHVLTGSSSDRLAADMQQAVAETMDIRAEPGWAPEDRLMREVWRQAREIDVRVGSVLEDLAGRLGSDRARPRVAVDRSPSSLTETLHDLAVMAEGDGVAAPSALRQAGHAPVADMASTEAFWSPDAVDALLRVLGAGEPGSRALETMDVMGLLAWSVPEWDRVAGRPQRDPYHRFPVDVHLMATAAEAARLLRSADEPFAVEAVRSLEDPSALLLGALLHDIGKVGSGAHVPKGVEFAQVILARMGLAGATREQVLFLVREHLLLSDTATRRNLDDEDLILHVAARIRDDGRLAMLYLLTVADAVATGPSAATPWRMALVRDLVAKVSRVFSRGSMDRRQAERLDEVEAQVRRELASVPGEDVDRFLEAVPTGYLLAVEPADMREHVRLILPAPAESEVRSSFRPGRSPGAYLAALGARDRLGLLASVAGAMTLSGMSILTAQVFTTEHGVALDLFEVRGAFEPEVSDERWQRFERTLGESLRGGIDVSAEVETLRSHYRPPRAGVPVSVVLHQDASDFFTLVEVEGPDRMGLLFDLTSALAGNGFDVHSARVATYGARVVDVFYVTDADGRKVSQAEREADLERVLLDAVSPPSA
jgi:[protein-PII] uridylyltransferase